MQYDVDMNEMRAYILDKFRKEGDFDFLQPGELESMADAMLVSMRDDISVNDTLPGKVQSYMAAGKPVLGSIAGETAYVIEQAGCGFCAPPDDPEAFAQVVRRFLSCEDREARGKREMCIRDRP